MAHIVQFAVDDSSPTVAYSPFGDTFSLPNLSAGWNPYFLGSGFASNQGQTGIGQSQHITSSNNASLTLKWHGTSIQLFGNITDQAAFSITLDGTGVQLNSTNTTQPNLLASLDGLPDTDHSITLTANIPQPQVPPDSSLLVFDKAVITSPPPPDFSQTIFTEHTVDDDDINFSGQWSLIPTTGQAPVRQSQFQTDTAQVTFSGVSVRIFGTTSPSAGNYSVLLDDTQFPILSARSSFLSTSSLLFFASGLAANTSHQITIRNEGGTLQLMSGGFIVFSSGEPTALPPPANSSPPTHKPPLPYPPPPPPPLARFTRGTIAALVLAGFLAFVILTAVLFYFCIWRPRRQQRRRGQRDADFAFVSPPSRFHHPRKHVPRAYRDSSYPHEKDQKRDSAAIGGPLRDPGAILDIRPPARPEETADSSPHDDTINPTPDGVSAAGSNDLPTHRDAGQDGRRESGKSGVSGFARWKRDINTLSGLTALGLNFRHSDEKSPTNNYGTGGDFDGGNNPGDFIYGRYYSGVDGGKSSGGDEYEAARIRSVSTQSSSRFGGKRSGKNLSGSGTGNGKGKGRLSSRIGNAGFPFRLSSSSRRGESSGSGQRDLPRDDESLSGFTSLSYASNPEESTAYLDIQPPSYAASISQNTASGSNASSPPSVPRSVTQSPRSQSRNFDGPPSPQDLHGPSPLSEVPPVPVVEEQYRQSSHPSRTRSTDDNSVHPTGMHILGMGDSLAGVGGPISMRSAIRGLSPRISKTRSGERRRSRTKGKGKEKNVEKKQLHQDERMEEQEITLEAREMPPYGRSRSDIAISGHEKLPGGNTIKPAAPPIDTNILAKPSNVVASLGKKTGSPIRALPPIPTSSSSSSGSRARSATSQPQPEKIDPPNKDNNSHKKDQQSKPSEPSSPTLSSSYLSIPQSSPFKLSFDQPSTPTSVTPPPPSPPSSNNSGGRFRARSSTGDAAGLGPLGVIQSFAEAAAMATSTNNGNGAGAATGGILIEVPSGRSENGEGRRLSTASRVRFEDDPTNTNTDLPAPVEEARSSPTNVERTEEPETEVGFRPTPPHGLSPASAAFAIHDASMTVPEPTSDAGHEATRPPETAGPASFLDFSSQPSSLHSRSLSQATGLERSASSGTADTGPKQEGRVWSMQLPGRHILVDSETALKSKWSNTTLHTTHSSSSNSNSGYGSPAMPSAVVVTSEGSPRSNIFPFPLAIPPSPNMPEGFAGVEPSPSLMSPTATLPTPNPSNTAGTNRRLQPQTPGVTGTQGPPRHGHGHDENNDSDENVPPGNNDSPTDSFPYSISEIHFRHSVNSVSDVDLEPGRVQSASRQHVFAHHPPLPSAALTPQRFTPPEERLQTQQSSNSLVQRVFGSSSGSQSGSATPRTPR